jgi:glycosyltransferase involved in cell wall biosynthesis
MLRSFQNLGYEVVTCSPSPDQDSLNRLSELSIKHISFPLQRAGQNPFADWKTFRSLTKIMKHEKPDHVFSYTVKPVVFGSMAAKATKVPHVHALITGLGTAFQGSGFKRSLLNLVVKRLYRFGLSGCKSVIFQNPDDRALFLENGLVSSEKVGLVNGSGVDLDHFKQAPFPDEPISFLLVARLIEEKGIRVYVEAARIVRRNFPDAVFRIVGYLDDHPGSISQMELDSWINDGIIEFCGRAEDVRPFLADSHVYCLPSYREGLPRSVLESMSMGRSIITTDVPGCRETVINGENGFLVPAKNIPKLAEAMRAFCTNPALMTVMGNRSREIAENKFDVNQVNARIVQILGLTQNTTIS